MKSFLLKSFMLVCLLMMGMGARAEETIEIVCSDFTKTSYSTTETTFDKSGQTFGYINVMKNGSNGTPSGWAKEQVIQCKNSGTFYNTTPISILKSIRVYLVVNTNTFTVTAGSTSECSDYSQARPTAATGTENIDYTTYAKGGVTSSSTTSASYYDFDLSGVDEAQYFNITIGSSTVYIHKIVLTYEDVNDAPEHTAHFSINGTINAGDDCVAKEGNAITFPSDPAVDGVVFKGWATNAIIGTQIDTPEFVNTTSASMGNADITYYAVFATEGEGGEPTETKTQTLEYDTWTYYGSTSNKSSYRLFHSGSYIESAAFDRSKLSKVVVKGGTFGGDTYNKLTIGDGTNTWKTVTVSGSSQTGVNTYTNGTALSGNGPIRITSNSGTASSSGIRISAVEIYTLEPTPTYSDYCTTVSLDPQPTIILSATELAEYTGNTNTSITASVSENTYTGALTIASSNDDVATATISEGTINIQAVAAGTATLTVTAPATTGFRKNTATIAVTISEKLAHGLSFDADALNLTVGDTEFTEPTLSNPNSLPVVYSLVYATPASEGKVATIDPSTGKVTLAAPSLSTETQGAVTVKASTVGDNSHIAGEATYSLVVSRKVSTTAWSNGGEAMNIDQDEIEQLPTASNDADRNISYESSNTDVATIAENGTVTFVAYGTTTITAKTSATAEYAATSATYVLTFAPRYTVTFNVNGDETVLREETPGAGVTAPVVEPIHGKVFRGWTEAEIDGMTNDAPAFATIENLKENKTLYAVFATKSGSEPATISYGWETTFDNSLWAEENLSSGEAYSTYKHSGSYAASTSSSSTTAYIQTKNIIANPASATCYYSKASSNNNSTSKFVIQVSANGADWTNVSTGKTMDMVTQGTFEELTADLSSYSNVYVRFYYNGTTAIRIIDDVSVSYEETSYSDYCTTIPASVPVTVTSAGMATFTPSVDLDFTNATKVKAYTGAVSGEVVTLTEVTKVKAGEGVLLVAEGGATEDIDVAAEAVAAAEGNAFVGVLTAIPALATAGENCTNYILNNGSQGIGFYWANGQAVAAGKAYLKVPAANPARALRLVFGESTAINNVNANAADNVYYNLAGQRVNAQTKGIVVVNGKKLINK